MNEAANENCSTPAGTSLPEIHAATRHHCLVQVDDVAADLARLQGLLDDAMSRLGGAFATLAHAAEADRHEEARDVLISTLQYHDVCTQLLAHARDRLSASRTLMATGPVDGAAELPEAPRKPVLQHNMTPGSIELF